VETKYADILDDLIVERRKIQTKLAATRVKNEQKQMPKIMLNYRPDGWRRLGRPWRGLNDSERVCQGLPGDGDYDDIHVVSVILWRHPDECRGPNMSVKVCLATVTMMIFMLYR